MEAKTAMTVEEYLRTAFDNPDREYRDGRIVERGVPDRSHSMAQLAMMMYFMDRASLGFLTFPSLRLKISQNLCLVPDVCVYPNDPPEEIPSQPPIIAIEILSREEAFSTVRAKLQDFYNWGVRHVWLLDPHQKRMYTCDGAFAEVPTLRVPELGLEVTPADAFGA